MKEQQLRCMQSKRHQAKKGNNERRDNCLGSQDREDERQSLLNTLRISLGAMYCKRMWTNKMLTFQQKNTTDVNLSSRVYICSFYPLFVNKNQHRSHPPPPKPSNSSIRILQNNRSHTARNHNEAITENKKKQWKGQDREGQTPEGRGQKQRTRVRGRERCA